MNGSERKRVMADFWNKKLVKWKEN